MFLSPAVHAAGLGKLTVLSALGQPLRAEIELTAVSPEEASALVAKLAPAEAFQQANIDFNPTLLSLNFIVEQRAGRQFIRVSSSQPVNEPFVDMLLELSWNTGRLVREYTFLLDPVDMNKTQPAQVAAPQPQAPAQPPVAAPAQPQSQPQPATAAQAPVAPPQRSERAPRPVPVPAAAPTPVQAAKDKPKKTAGADYKVKAGDTLSRIANQVKPADVSLDVMLVALYRANPEAFSGKNMNRLQSGRILSVPDADTLRNTAEGEAKGVVVAHASDFSAYRNKLAGQVAQSTPSKAAPAAQSAAGKISTKVEERATPANESKDQLKLSKAEPASAAAGKTAVANVEDKIAKEKQVAEAAARVKELEKNVNDLENLMAVKNKSLADQKKPDAVASAPVVASAPAAEPAAPKPKPVPLVKKAPPPEPSLMDKLMDNISNIGLVLAALLLAVFLVVRRKKKEPPKAENSFIGEADVDDPLTPVPAAAFGEAESQGTDAYNNVFESSFALNTSQIDTNEADPVAEAEVYIAYGHDSEAEELLLGALRTNPERHAARLKLLEIYSARKNTRQFEDQASELYSLTRGQGDEWRQAAALGLALDPLNPLYANTDVDAVVHFSKAPVENAEHNAQSAALDSLDRDLSRDAAAVTGQSMDFTPAASASEETALPTPASADGLDFDLGDLNFEPIAITPPASAPAAPAVNINKPAEPQFDNSMDFGLDLEPMTAGGTITATPAPDPLMDLDLMNFDLPETKVKAADITPEANPAVTPAASPAAAPISTDDIFAQAAATTAAVPEAAAAVPEFDLSGIDLDLGAGDKAAGAVQDDALSGIHMEMDTKLDLAIAYQEIGDKEGARELIDEVIKGGNAEQVAKANTMRALLS
ncbi:FimV/HubP family polar landmark protein [Janthinobacterium agaricidamnosum]|uniref:LysM domain protein n=1 Tax=Janthinobacterium agaricidamnosum NBRC 102515 = DSM 9628 TaxID=1349767 RepID=W0VA42_9BURK|nr:FimV/HubP family polar landmark protein [Janthinobacterium agaricidamnosum]CDG84228.1 lysM domain protein [Janthinobacterium agaricidamnosum NBRC 102515 = DSM 9628]